MGRLLGLLVLVVGGWAVWSYVLQPALEPPVAAHSTVVHRAPTPLPSPTILTGQQGAVTSRARAFLASWSAGRYRAMYGGLSLGAQGVISETAFIDRYRAIAAVAALTRVHPAIVATSVRGEGAVVTYTVSMDSSAVGPIQFTASMPLRYEAGAWRIDWSPNLIFPGLAHHLVHLFPEPARRGAIVDRLGRPLAVQGNMIQIGVIPQYIAKEKPLLAFLSALLHMPSDTIRALYHVPWAVGHPSWFVPIGLVTSVQWNALPLTVVQQQMSDGLEYQTGASRRLYPQGTLAAPLLGYVNGTDGHGSVGLERWADGYLSGHDGASLAIANPPDFQYVVSTIKERPVQDGATVRLTIDATLQQAAEQALAGKVGSVVAIRPSDGAILAMASTPGFDPGLFATGITQAQLRALLNDPNHPLINRAATGQYPLGSVFKIVTAATAMEKAGYTAATPKDCPGIWYGLGPAYPKRDWLASGHGVLTLHEAIVQSCDTYFYQVGQQLDAMGHNLLPDYARSWGFGQTTGVPGVAEGAGLIPDPHWTLAALGQSWVPGNAVDMAIGQGYVEVTPLQVAQMLAAMANHGVMYRPSVVQSVTAPGGASLRPIWPLIERKLPISQGHLDDILTAMHGVTTEPYGTATSVFTGFPWSVAGKTGTAQSGDGRQPHAWFAAIAPADHPRIALVVMVEHGGEGSAVAAPLARQILQTFFTKDRDLAGTAGSGGSVLVVP